MSGLVVAAAAAAAAAVAVVRRWRETRRVLHGFARMYEDGVAGRGAARDVVPLGANKYISCVFVPSSVR